MERLASYVVDRDVSYYVTTIHWSNDLTGRAWNETGIRDLNLGPRLVDRGFTLIAHDIWPLEEGHRAMVRLLKDGVTPREIRDRTLWVIPSVMPRRALDGFPGDNAPSSAAQRANWPTRFGASYTF